MEDDRKITLHIFYMSVILLLMSIIYADRHPDFHPYPANADPDVIYGP
jgi:hypothetical protein